MKEFTILKDYNQVQKLNQITILSDSLAMPRPDEVECPIFYRDIYSYKLESRLGIRVINRARRSNTTKEQSLKQNMYDDILFLNSKFVILHLGICDCAPRLFSKRFGKYFVNNIRPEFLRNKFVKFFSDYRYTFTKLYLIQDVNAFNFSVNLDYILKFIINSGSVPIVVDIAQTSEKNNSRSYLFNSHISKYNEIIYEKCKKYDSFVVNLNSESRNRNLLISDGIHLNIEGHDFIFEEILKIVEKLYQY
jgi:hypothetical protein